MPPSSFLRRLMLRHGPMGGMLLFCSFCGCVLLLMRWAYAGVPAYRFLVWNLFLAWVPLGFAMLAHGCSAEMGKLRKFIIPLLIGWLLFFPNAPYLITDLKHFGRGRGIAPIWFDAICFSTFIGTGVLLGFASLTIVHDLAARWFGRRWGWGTIAGCAMLSGFGIYLGRFVRLNSWDVLTRPMWVLEGALTPFIDPADHGRAWVVTLLYGGFVLLGYVTLIVVGAGIHRHFALPEPPKVRLTRRVSSTVCAT